MPAKALQSKTFSFCTLNSSFPDLEKFVQLVILTTSQSNILHHRNSSLESSLSHPHYCNCWNRNFSFIARFACSILSQPVNEEKSKGHVCSPINRHDICQMFYTSTVSKILKFTQEEARKSRHFRLLIWNFGISINIIWLISQFSSPYAHFFLNPWLQWLKIPKQNSIILIELWNFTRI